MIHDISLLRKTKRRKKQAVKIATLPRHIVAIAQSRSLPELLHSTVTSLCDCSLIRLARVWLIRGGDICATCRFRRECPDQTRCLHLVASAGNRPEGGLCDTGTEGAYRRFPLGVRKIGRVAASGDPILLSGLTGHEEWIVDRAWFQRAGVRSFAAQPLIYRGETLGVLGIFDAMELGEAEFEWLRIFADHAAVSIANAHAFEEIAYLKERLEEENSYLREEVSAARGPGDLVGRQPGVAESASGRSSSSRRPTPPCSSPARAAPARNSSPGRSTSAARAASGR